MLHLKRPTKPSMLITALAVFTALVGSNFAGAADVAEIELRRLFDPTQSELAAEAKGRIYIYDGLTDADVQQALNQEFERVENMMFIRTRKTDADGQLKRNENTGEVEVEDDGC